MCGLSITLEARMISDGSEVCRETGQKVYNLQRKIKLYNDKNVKNKMPDIISSEGVVFLVSDGAINCIPDTTKLKLLFEDEYEALEFLQHLTD